MVFIRYIILEDNTITTFILGHFKINRFCKNFTDSPNIQITQATDNDMAKDDWLPTMTILKKCRISITFFLHLTQSSLKRPWFTCGNMTNRSRAALHVTSLIWQTRDVTETRTFRLCRILKPTANSDHRVDTLKITEDGQVIFSSKLVSTRQT